VHRCARRAGIKLQLAGCDINPLAVDYARAHAGAPGLHAEFFTFDALRDPFPAGFDVIMASLFWHHLGDDDAVAFLRRAAGATRGLVLVHDLVRSRPGYLLAALGIPLLGCNVVCRKDGPASVQGAFTVEEARALADRAGLTGAIVFPRFPCRFLLQWQKP
jgi:2-polyprenyl-3-methyl-5-hydroxy-6-metoxy-1,4-benzoquinol methylase